MEKIIKTPGRRYLGPKGTEMAAIKIQVAAHLCFNDAACVFVYSSKSEIHLEPRIYNTVELVPSAVQ